MHPVTYFCTSSVPVHYLCTVFVIINKHKPRVYGLLTLSYGEKWQPPPLSLFKKIGINYRLEILNTAVFLPAKNLRIFWHIPWGFFFSVIFFCSLPFLYISDIYYPVIVKSWMPKFNISLSDKPADFHLPCPVNTIGTAERINTLFNIEF